MKDVAAYHQAAAERARMHIISRRENGTKVRERLQNSANEEDGEDDVDGGEDEEDDDDNDDDRDCDDNGDDDRDSEKKGSVKKLQCPKCTAKPTTRQNAQRHFQQRMFHEWLQHLSNSCRCEDQRNLPTMSGSLCLGEPIPVAQVYPDNERPED